MMTPGPRVYIRCGNGILRMKVMFSLGGAHRAVKIDPSEGYHVLHYPAMHWLHVEDEQAKTSPDQLYLYSYIRRSTRRATTLLSSTAIDDSYSYSAMCRLGIIHVTRECTHPNEDLLRYRYSPKGAKKTKTRDSS